ncbi:MAG: M14 family zinc carboxypeptidase [Planctomycetota bacterium]
MKTPPVLGRREVVAGMAAAALGGLGSAQAEPPKTPEFWKSGLADVDEAVRAVRKGEARVLARSAGQRNIHLVSYGPRVERKGTANYGSACAGLAPAAYALKDGTQRPVVFLLGPVHGGEVEGIAGLLNLLRVAESGQDSRGHKWERLAENIAQCRLLIVPSGNPDGRARFPWECSVGQKLEDYERLEMGVTADGQSFHWPGVKRLHPMRGPTVGKPGTYFNDRGINLMHDEWFAPMADETVAFLNLAREEAPDFIVSLHSRASYATVLPTAYVPRTVKAAIEQLGARLQERYAAAGLPHRQGGPKPEEDGVTFPPPSFNLASALHHTCGAVAMVYEVCMGVDDKRYPQVDHAQILDLEMLLYDELLQFAVEQRVNWAAGKK